MSNAKGANLFKRMSKKKCLGFVHKVLASNLRKINLNKCEFECRVLVNICSGSLELFEKGDATRIFSIWQRGMQRDF